jgi:hypothetical protein
MWHVDDLKREFEAVPAADMPTVVVAPTEPQKAMA